MKRQKGNEGEEYINAFPKLKKLWELILKALSK